MNRTLGLAVVLLVAVVLVLFEVLLQLRTRAVQTM
jgi:tetrahydromethanopterin S-methyltransferase subunit F